MSDEESTRPAEDAPGPLPQPDEAPPTAPASGEGRDDAPQPAPTPASDALPSEARRPWTRLAWDLGLILALVLIVWLASQVKGFTIPFLIAFIIAYLLDPLVDRFEATGVSRTLAIGILLGLFSIAAGLLGLLMIPQVMQEFSLIPVKLKLFLSQAQPWIEAQWGRSLPADFGAMVGTLGAELSGENAGALLEPAKKVVSLVFGSTATVFSALVALTLIPIFAFFLLRDFDIIIAKLNTLIPLRYQAFVGAKMTEIDETLSRFVRGQLSVAGILVLLYGVGLWLVGLPLALVIAVVAGVGNLVPYLGTTLGIALAAVMLMLDWQGWGYVGSVALVFGVVQILEGWVITPRIIGDSVGLSTLSVIVAVMIFGELFGFYGVLIAVPAAAVLKILLSEVIDAYRASSFFREA